MKKFEVSSSGGLNSRDRGPDEAGDGHQRWDRGRPAVRSAHALTRQHAVPQVAVEGPAANGSQGTFWFPGLCLYLGRYWPVSDISGLIENSSGLFCFD
jgi:hypothetical protein